MAVIDDILANVTAANTVEQSAIVFINGVPALIQAAVAQAQANGATAAQLQPVTDAATQLKANADALAAAITANTPAAPAA